MYLHGNIPVEFLSILFRLVKTRQFCSTNDDECFPSSKFRTIKMQRLVYCQLLPNSCQFSLLKGLREY